MRSAFISADDDETDDSIAYDFAPWAKMVTKVKGGWLAFESLHDWYQWKGHEHDLTP